MGTKLGLDAKLFRNTGSYETPTWTEITNVKDVTLNFSGGEADVSTRNGNGWRENIRTLRDAELSFDMVHDTEDAGYNAIRASFFSDVASEQIIELLVADGPTTAGSGSTGFRASFFVRDLEKTEPLEEAQMMNVTMKVARTENPPEEWDAPES